MGRLYSRGKIIMLWRTEGRMKKGKLNMRPLDLLKEATDFNLPDLNQEHFRGNQFIASS